jgi:hypothetical protein
MTSALDDASIAAGYAWEASWFDFGGAGDFFVTKIGSDAGDISNFWATVLNFMPTQVGGCQQKVQEGDDVLFAYGTGSEHLLRLSGPPKAAISTSAAVTVVDGKDGTPVAGASVGGTHTGADGTATLTFAATGLVKLKAEAPDSIRSNAFLLCVSETGTGDCDVPAGTLGSPAGAPGPQARGTKAPSARISGLRDGARYRRGPRVLRGVASDDTGVSAVKLALRRHVKGRPCRWWSGRRERFVGTGCRKTFFFAIGDDASWSYQLSHRLGPGRYVLDVKAFDHARNRDERFVRGRNRVVFEVLGRKKGRGGRPPPAPAGERRSS